MDTRAKFTPKELSPEGRFYRMRDNWLRHILIRPKTVLSPVEKLVALRIGTSINPELRYWVISQARIAADLEVKERIVKSAVSKLKKNGLVTVRRVRIGGNRKMFNAYSLVPVEMAEPPQNDE